MTMCMRALFAVSLVALSSAETLAEMVQSTACMTAATIALNQSVQCLHKIPLDHWAKKTLNQSVQCLEDWDKTLASENLAVGCTNASSDITGDNQAHRQVLIDIWAVAKQMACKAALENAINKSVQCLDKAGCCREDFDTTLAAENLAKGCTNASSDITVQTQMIEAQLTVECAGWKSFRNAAIGFGIGGTVCLCCLCACCIGIIMKCVGGKKKGGRTDEESSSEEEDIE